MTLSTIQVNANLGKIRACKDWTSIIGVVTYSSKKAVSNEKIKRQKKLHQFGFE